MKPTVSQLTSEERSAYGERRVPMTIVTPLHQHFSPLHLAHVIERMHTLGPPRIRASFDTVTGVWFAQEGTHRLRAAKQLGLAPVMLPVPWRRGQRALERARYAARRGHVFERVEVKGAGDE